MILFSTIVSSSAKFSITRRRCFRRPPCRGATPTTSGWNSLTAAPLPSVLPVGRWWRASLSPSVQIPCSPPANAPAWCVILCFFRQRIRLRVSSVSGTAPCPAPLKKSSYATTNGIWWTSSAITTAVSGRALATEAGPASSFATSTPTTMLVVHGAPATKPIAQRGKRTPIALPLPPAMEDRTARGGNSTWAF